MREHSALLKFDIEEAAKRPPIMPVADYPGIVKERTNGKSSKVGTPFERLTISISGWPEGIDADTRRMVGSVTGKTMHKDYWYSIENGRWNRDLPKLLKELGFTGDGELALSRIVGSRVLVRIKHKIVDKDRDGSPLDEPYSVAEINSLIGVEA